MDNLLSSTKCIVFFFTQMLQPYTRLFLYEQVTRKDDLIISENALAQKMAGTLLNYLP